MELQDTTNREIEPWLVRQVNLLADFINLKFKADGVSAYTLSSPRHPSTCGFYMDMSRDLAIFYRGFNRIHYDFNNENFK